MIWSLIACVVLTALTVWAADRWMRNADRRRSFRPLWGHIRLFDREYERWAKHQQPKEDA